ncbi:MAG: mitotic spindle checkpoint protein Bub3 [Marteilia pararefringens]
MHAWPNQQVAFVFEEEEKFRRHHSATNQNCTVNNSPIDNQLLRNDTTRDCDQFSIKADHQQHHHQQKQLNTLSDSADSIRNFLSRCRFVLGNPQFICATRFSGFFYTFKYHEDKKVIEETSINGIGSKSPLMDFQINYRNESKAYISTMSGKIFSFDLNQKKEICIGKHDNAIVALRFMDDYNLLASASWDSYVKFWDLRTTYQTTLEITNIKQPSKIYAMDSSCNCLVLATSDNHVLYWDTRFCKQPLLDLKTRVKSQIRCIKSIDNDFGHMIGTSDGQVYVEYLDKISPSKLDGNILISGSSSNTSFQNESNPLNSNERIPVNDLNVDSNSVQKNKDTPINENTYESVKDMTKQPIEVFYRNKIRSFSFNCHRNNLNYKKLQSKNIDKIHTPATTEVYGINDLSNNPIYNLFATAGSDGKVGLWDYTSKRKLGIIRPSKYGIYSVDFSADGTKLLGATNFAELDSYSSTRTDNNVKHSIFIHEFNTENFDQNPR